jgi:NhaA family Na+:H+ antiporter
VQLAGRPLQRFLAIEAASGITLLFAAGVALAAANSSWADGYAAFWHTPIGVRLGAFTFERSLEWIVNDGLMVIFFFVVGLEIRRELQYGELSEWRRAALPAIAALGGMLAPAGIYLALAGSGAAQAGWGIPMATDIAFAVGILALLGQRVSAALRVLLLALAVIDDLGAIIVIALFYSAGVGLSGLLVAALGFAMIIVMQRFGIRSKPLYVAPALVAWAGTYHAGIHPTIAGVVLGLLTPVRAWLGPQGFVDHIREPLERLAGSAAADGSHHSGGALREVAFASREAVSPAESLIEMLHPWVAYCIMPLFALANAGVALSGAAFDADSTSVAVGVGVGLLLGKPVGVLASCWLSLRLGVARLPAGVGWRDLAVLGVIAGVGFTMSLFVSQLAFVDGLHLSAAKLGVLSGSAMAAVLGLALGQFLLPRAAHHQAASSPDEAERSTEK